jgi:hypothetical protein
MHAIALHNLYSSPNTEMVKLRKMAQAEHEARMRYKKYEQVFCKMHLTGHDIKL